MSTEFCSDHNLRHRSSCLPHQQKLMNEFVKHNILTKLAFKGQALKTSFFLVSITGPSWMLKVSKSRMSLILPKNEQSTLRILS